MKAGSTTAVTRRGRLFATLLQSLTKRNASRSATLTDLCPPLADVPTWHRSACPAGYTAVRKKIALFVLTPSPLPSMRL